MREINLKSDTTTKPTDEMRKAMFEAEVGDDIYNDDPTVKKLQKLAAEVTGMEDALFFPSGTMANLAAVMSHTRHGEEVILDDSNHMHLNEGAGIISVAGLSPRFIKAENGIMTPDDIRDAFRTPNIGYPKTSLVIVENTHNAGGGTVYPIERLKEIHQITKEKNIKLHMDGARVFNAAAYLNVSVKEITQHVDSVMFCVSKGLSAPIGSMLCGTKELIAEAIRKRKILGGGLRQVGVIAAAGIVAINEMPGRLKEDHDNARILAEAISKNPCISIKLDTVQTNIVYFELKDKLGADEFAEILEKNYGVRCNVFSKTKIRMLTNRHISKEDVLFAADSINSILK